MQKPPKQDQTVEDEPGREERKSFGEGESGIGREQEGLLKKRGERWEGREWRKRGWEGK